MSQEQDNVFKIPAVPSGFKTPEKRPRRVKRKIELVDSDDEDEISQSPNSKADGSQFDRISPFKSQSMSQLSQMFNNPGQVNGTFTYLSPADGSHYFPPAYGMSQLNPSLETTKLNDNFARSIHHLMSRQELIVPAVNDNTGLIVPPFNDNIVAFLRYYFRYYPYLNRGRYKGNFMAARAQYLNFWRTFLLESIYTMEFNRQHIWDILWNPNIRKESQPNDYSVNMMLHISNYYKRYIAQPVDKKQNENNEEPIRYEDTFAFLTDWLDLYVEFLYKDALHFVKNRSQSLFVDLTSPEHGVERPLVVRIFWSSHKPEYTSSTIKFLLLIISKMQKVPGILGPTVKLLSLVSEMLRLGTGNLRPYTSINSSRVLIVSELYGQLSNLSLATLSTYRRIFPHFGPCVPWLRVQFAVELLARHGYLNFYHFFPQAVESTKYRLTLRLLVHTYLLGDVSKFKFDVGTAERTRRRRRESTEAVLARSSKRLRERREIAQVCKEKADQDYRKFMTTKTSYGGNALHVLCRQGKKTKGVLNEEAIADLMKHLDVNQSEHRGYTPLMDAVRFENFNLAKMIIDVAEKSGTLIDFTLRNDETHETVLHLAIRQAHWPTIKNILEVGGKHLLTIETNDSLSPLDLIEDDDELKKKIDKIEYRDYEKNILPVWRADDEEAKLYVFLITEMLEAYLETTKLIKFARKTCKHGRLDVQEFNLNFAAIFKEAFDRKPFEQDVDNYKDDVAVFLELRGFVDCFLKRQFKTDDENDDEKSLEQLGRQFQFVCRLADRAKGRSAKVDKVEASGEEKTHSISELLEQFVFDSL